MIFTRKKEPKITRKQKYIAASQGNSASMMLKRIEAQSSFVKISNSVRRALPILSKVIIPYLNDA